MRVLDLKDWPTKAHDCLHKQDVSAEELEVWYAEAPSLMEEALFTQNEPIPRDFKVYCIDGVPRIVGVFNRNQEGKPEFDLLDLERELFIPWSEIFYWPPEKIQWKTAGRLENTLVDRAIQAGQFAKDILPMIDATDLFMSVDCYVVGANVYLGELTPRPGAVHAPDLRERFIRFLLAQN